jgi:hypothetical protein
MKFDLATIIKIQSLIGIGVALVDKLKAPGADKKKVLIEGLPDALAKSELALGINLFNDPEIAKLVGAVIDAEAAVVKAQGALKAGLLTRQVNPDGSVVAILD